MRLKFYAMLDQLIQTAVALTEKFGYAGIFFTQMLESFFVPIPSEVVLPFSGFLASRGLLSLWLVVIVATLANVCGAFAAYVIGWYAGRPFLERYGRYILLYPSDISRLDKIASRHGALVSFFARLIPGIRTISSLVLGSFKIKFKPFLTYTIVGSFLWNLPLAYVGYTVGERWNFLQPYFHKFEIIIGVLIVAGVVFFIAHQVSKHRLNRV